MVKKKREETVDLRWGFNERADWVFAVLLLAVVLVQYSFLSDFNQLPGPVYGGDVYRHFGQVLHIYHGGSPFHSFHYLGEFEHYPFLTHFVVALMAWLFFSSALSVAMLWFPLLSTLLAGIFSYLLAKRVFRNSWLSCLFGLFWVTTLVPNLGPSMVAQYVMLPLLAWSWLAWDSIRQRAWAGIIYGLVGLQHATLFIGACFFLALRFIYNLLANFFILENAKFKVIKKPFWPACQVLLKRYALIVLIGIPIALLYWWAPIFVYHGQTLNPWQEYSGQGVSSLTFGLVFRAFYTTIISSSDWLATVLTLLALLGVYASFRQKNWVPAWSFWVIGVVGIAHPFFTQPLLGTSFGFYRFSLFLGLARVLFVFLGAQFLLDRFKRWNLVQYLVLALLLLLVLVQGYRTFDSFGKDYWVGAAKDKNLEGLFAFADWVVKNTDSSKSVISSHGESAFAFNAVTGRKVVIMRRTHSNPYSNENKRIADAAVMLYGRNPSKARELVQKYNVGYLYEDGYSVQSRSICAGLWANFSRGEYPDQMYACLQASPAFANYLTENGIEFQPARVRLDPSEANAPLFDMLLIKPRDFENFNLQVVQMIGFQDKPAAVLWSLQPK